MNVLLAEDNPVNQEVAVGLLEMADCAVTVVENGRQAVDAALGGGFDLVLMDCQMPVMDGLDATRAIRDAAADDRQLPIVALTANDSEDVRSDCLAAGMDDFLGKPFSRQDLLALLQRLCPAAVSVSPAEPAASVAPRPSSLDPEAMATLHALDPKGERNLAHRAITMFVGYSDKLITRIADAIGTGDIGEVSRIAHSLKSSSANLGAMAVAKQCADIEHLTRHGSLPDDIDQRLTALEAAHRLAKRDLLLLIEGG